MKTPAQLGYLQPEDGDYLKEGAEAIRVNAEVTAALMNRLLAGNIDGTPVPAGADLNEYRTTGMFLISTGSVWATLLNRPESTINRAGWLEVKTTPNGLVRQTISTYSADPAEWTRTTTNVATLALGPWKRTDGAPVTLPDPQPAPQQAGADTGLINRLLLEDFTSRHKGTKSTKGRPAVAIRLDHGLANLAQHVLPLLRKYGFPFSIAMLSRGWTRPENAGITAADVQAWVKNDRAEIWNHGATHGAATTSAELQDEIVTGLAELRAQFPGVPIDGFVVPGVGTPGYGGFNGGGTPAAFYGTEAGRLILQHHAISTGSIYGTSRRVLDGTPRQGQGHFTLDASTPDAVAAQLRAVARDLTGLQLMLHPSLLNTEGFMTTDVLDQVFALIAAERDAGRLVVLSPYELMLADSRTP